MLGDVQIRGATRELSRLEIELLAYLATRDEPVTSDDVQAALWPNRQPGRGHWFNVLSHIRRAVGDHNLPRIPRDGKITLGPGVTCDLDLLRDRLRAADHQTGTRRLDTLHAAVSLIRGQPFTAPQGYGWAHARGILSYTEALVVDAVHQLVSELLDAGQLDAALDTIRAGIHAAPAYETLYRDRMRAEYATGSISGVEAAMQDLCAALELDDPFAEVHPDTLSLYEQLAGRSIVELRERRQRTG